MATSTRSRSSRSAGRRARRSGGGSSKRGSARLSAAAARFLGVLRGLLDDQMRDVYGLGLLLVAVIAGLGMYAERAGLVGLTLAALLRGLLGMVGHAVPPLLGYLGVLLVANRPVEERGRKSIGLSLLLAAAAGGWHLVAGAPQPAEGIRALWPAGGLAGWAVSRPLVVGLARGGAAIVLLTAFVLGLLIFTKTPVRRVGTGLVGAVRWLRPWLVGRPSLAGDPTDAGSATAGQTDPDDRQDADRQAGAGDPLSDQRAMIDAHRAAAGPVTDVPVPDSATGRGPAGPDGDRRTAWPGDGSVHEGGAWEGYELPPLDLLASGRAAAADATRRHSAAQARALQATFDEFGVQATVARTFRGPTVTRFEVELDAGVKVKKVSSLDKDISYALASADVRIVAPIPGKSAIGVEVPNRDRDLITVRDILDSDEARADLHPLRVALGADIAGRPALVNLATMPHLLISGATGAGKSVTLNSMLVSVLTRARPDQVRMLLIDPKRVELNHFDGTPHLLNPVIVDPKKATNALGWVVEEMERRYETLAELGFRKIDSYNRAVAEGSLGPSSDALFDRGDDPRRYRHLPYILVAIDELADLMLVAPRDVENAVCRIAQMARAVGIHLVIATQRPSVDVITGLIKANIPSRLALATASATDSRTILDQGGAEKLVGHGDMLFQPSSQGKPSRLQGCFVSESEVDALVAFCARQRPADYVDGVTEEAGVDPETIDLAEVSAEDDDELLLLKAADLVVRSGLGSTSMLQRKLRIGFARAGRLMDELEEHAVVGPSQGSKAREVLMTVEELEDSGLDGDRSGQPPP